MQTCRVRSYETDAHARLKLVSLLNYFEDIAGEHANSLHVGGDALMEQNLIWMLSRLTLEISRLPEWGEEITIMTWPFGWKKIFALRGFEVTAENGEVIAQASTSWLLVDIEKRAMVEVAPRLAHVPLNKKTLVDERLAPVPRLREVERSCSFPIRRSDIDMNRHVNNAVYLDWALEAVDQEVAESATPTRIEIAYRAEAHYGESVVSELETLETNPDQRFAHRIRSEADGRELARVCSLWAKGSE